MKSCRKCQGSNQDEVHVCVRVGFGVCAYQLDLNFIYTCVCVRLCLCVCACVCLCVYQPGRRQKV